MKYTIYGGKSEIGGNKILLEHKNSKIFLDFGMSFSQYKKYYSEFLNPRKVNGLQDFFVMGLLPDLEGIYREDYIRHMGRPSEKRKIDAILLSHAHADHAQYIHFVRPDIPIYCTKETKLILNALEKTSNTSFSDFTTFFQEFETYTNKKGYQSRVTRRKTEYISDRPFTIMEDEKQYKIGDFSIEMVRVDHSLPGACGFLINSNEGNLVYTGDIRFHGSKRNLSKRFVDKAKAFQPKWLLCEGTRIDSSQKDSEKDVKDKISSFMSNASGLIFVEHPIRDLDRVNTIYEATKANGRTFVINTKLAFLLKEFKDLSPFSLDSVKVFIPPKSWGLISKTTIDDKLRLGDYSNKWEREMVSWDNKILNTEIKQNPDKYVVSMNMWEINNLIELQPVKAIWIKSSCKPFSEEMELDEERKKNWLERFNIKEYSAHASGHASGTEIKKMIKEINPEILIPIHTEQPGLFEEK